MSVFDSIGEFAELIATAPSEKLVGLNKLLTIMSDMLESEIKCQNNTSDKFDALDIKTAEDGDLRESVTNHKQESATNHKQETVNQQSMKDGLVEDSEDPETETDRKEYDMVEKQTLFVLDPALSVKTNNPEVRANGKDPEAKPVEESVKSAVPERPDNIEPPTEVKNAEPIGAKPAVPPVEVKTAEPPMEVKPKKLHEKLDELIAYSFENSKFVTRITDAIMSEIDLAARIGTSPPWRIPIRFSSDVTIPYEDFHRVVSNLHQKSKYKISCSGNYLPNKFELNISK